MILSEAIQRPIISKTHALHTRSSTSREDILGQLIDFDGDIQMTLKAPKIMPAFSLKDTDWFETEIIRQFYININRVVNFEMLAYPEDKNKGRKFVGLHYHAVVKTNNKKKFCKVASRKYQSILQKVKLQHAGLRIQREPLWVGMIIREMELTDPYKYEEYILKNYDYSIRLVDTSAFQQVSPFQR
ncbi:hypothetical protein N9C56_13815 [Paracoccaceae bacterium]|nr:hypothetical protein [Paracoccaceae bacterium]